MIRATMVTTAAPSSSPLELNFGGGVLYAILGMLVVFFALVLLMVIIKILIKVTDSRSKKAAEAAPAVQAAEEPVPVKENGPAPGSAGQIKLYTTDPKDAAMIMAIVADTLGKPLNELRFISIREVKG